jgi:uncharacterized DUF497 family protein
MKIVGFVWLEEIVERLEVKHQVIPEEVEQVFSNQPRVKRMNKGHYRGEDVYRALGQTEAGRYLAVFFTATAKFHLHAFGRVKCSLA